MPDLKRGTVKLEPYQPQRKTAAENMIAFFEKNI